MQVTNLRPRRRNLNLMNRGCVFQRAHARSLGRGREALRHGNDNSNENGGKDRLDARHFDVDLGGLGRMEVACGGSESSCPSFLLCYTLVF